MTTRSPNRLMSYARLLRLSNGPTAVADVLMGLVIATGSLDPWPRSLLLIVSSLLLYHAGMVLNDVADVEQDLEERSNRPLPAGEISVSVARLLGRLMLVLGIGATLLVGWSYQQWWPTVIASSLAASIVAYNSRLKRTPLGPWLMGLCRALNGMLGLCVASNWTTIVSISPGIMIYVAGFTLFARNEASDFLEERFSRSELLRGAFIAIAGIGWLALAPLAWQGVGTFEQKSQQSWASTDLWLWLTVLAMVGRHFLFATIKPSAKSIQRAVVGAIQALVVINAVLVFAEGGIFYGLAIMALLPISKLLSQVIPAT